jgi:hypothetical protein
MTEMERKIVTLDDIERRHIQNHAKPYYDWIRQVVTLAAGSLTALVALQGHYVPRNPAHPRTLAIAWVALALTILFGLLALRAESSLHLASARRLRAIRATHGDAYATRFVRRSTGMGPGWIHRWSVNLMLLSFLVALVSLCFFSIANLGLLSL